MEIRNIEKKDAHQKHIIMSYCFQGKDSVATQEYIDAFVPENHIGMFDGDKLMSSLEIIPKDIIMYGKSMKMGGIGGVTSFPEYRYGGTAKMLILRSLEIMRERNMTISFLKPFSYSFYDRYGWATSFYKKDYNIPMPLLQKIGVNLHTFRRLSYDDLPAIKPIYERYALGYNGCVLRTDSDWKSRFGGNFVYGSIGDDGHITGYMIYSISSSTMNIQELVCDGINAKRDLLQFVYRHASQIKEAELAAAPDDFTDMILCEPPKTVINHKMMARVVDVQEFLKVYDYGCFNGEFNIKIIDPWTDWNNKTFNVSIKSETVSVSQTQQPENICVSIGALSQMVMGYAGFKKQVYMHKVDYFDADKESLFDEVFPDRKTDLCDFF